MKSFPDNDYSDWGKIWGEINVYIQPGRDIDLYTLKYIYISGAKLRLNYFPTTLPPLYYPLWKLRNAINLSTGKVAFTNLHRE